VPAPRVTESCSNLPASSPSCGPAPTTPMPVAPYEAPLAIETPGTWARSPALTINDAIMGRHVGITGRIVD
jgi:hypothetical protein